MSRQPTKPFMGISLDFGCRTIRLLNPDGLIKSVRSFRVRIAFFKSAMWN